MQTIAEVGDARALDAAIDSAFPGSRLSIARAGTGVLSVQLHRHGLPRPLGAGELSDGTLRYLLWVAALLSPRPAGLLVLNEPETSLHSDLLPAAADLIGHAATRTQVIAVTHSPILIGAAPARSRPTRPRPRTGRPRRHGRSAHQESAAPRTPGNPPRRRRNSRRTGTPPLEAHRTARTSPNRHTQPHRPCQASGPQPGRRRPGVPANPSQGLS